MKNEQERNEVLSKEGNCKDLNLYAMSKEGLIKKVQILMHELATYRRYEQEKGSLDKMDKERIQKQLVEKEIIISQMKKNESVLQNALKSKIKEFQMLQLELKQKETAVVNLKKQNDILKKQLCTIQKSKSKQYAQKFNAENRQAKERFDNLQKENKQSKKTIAQLINKVKILAQLNRETQQKLAESIIAKKIKKEVIIQTPKQDSFPQNKQNQDPNKPSNLRLQNLALKQQIRVLKQQMRELQQSKELLRAKFHERELLYSRMLPLKS